MNFWLFAIYVIGGIKTLCMLYEAEEAYERTVLPGERNVDYILPVWFLLSWSLVWFITMPFTPLFCEQYKKGVFK